MKLKIYCDGSCKGNGKKENIGGWAYIALKDENNTNIVLKKDSKQIKNTTNNKMELTAAIEGCKYILNYINLLFDAGDWLCEIYTDSAYIYNCISQHWYNNWCRNGWKNSNKEPVKNKELWEQLIPFFENKHFKFFKVKGHSKTNDENSFWNNKVDEMARGEK